MNKKIILSVFFVLLLFLSASAIHASDDNTTELNDADNILIDENQIPADTGNVKNQTELTPQSTNSYGYYNLILKDSNSNATLKNKTIKFTLNNVNYTATTNSNGVASVNLNVKPGNYLVSAYFNGDSEYGSVNQTSSVKVLATIKASDISKYYKGSEKYTATFYDYRGNVLANRQVSITVNGKTYSKKTNSKGSVSLAVDLKPGTYKVTTTNPSTGYKLTTTFKILSTIQASNLKKVAGDSKKFSAKFFKSNGKPLAKQYVKLKINSKVYKVKTNSKGEINFSLKSFKKGTYKVICYNKDSLTKTNKIYIYSIATTKLSTSFYNFLKDDEKVIKVGLTTNLDDDSNVGKIIKIKINGKTYSKKTDSDGFACLNVSNFNKGLYSVEYSYAGNKYFKAAKATNLVTILNGTIPKLTVKSTTSFGYGAGTLFKVKLTADNVPLAKRTMTFSVDGKTYTAKTDNNGIASIPIDLKIGSYTISYKTNTQYKVNGTSGSCEISVFKRNSTKLIWKCGTSYKDSLQTFKIFLTDTNGNPIENQEIELTIDGETYSEETDSEGYATIETSVALGKYKVSVKFKGNNNFIASSTSKSINVALSLFKNGINEKTSSSYSSYYLKSSNNCYVNNAKVKALVKKLTKGLKNNVDKAKAIYNYVRDNVGYQFYYNSKKGSTSTLTAKKGNCADQAHLLVAMYRAAGFKARYVHGTATFGSGRYGHVWTQVKVGNTWICADPTSYRNSLGKVANWNTNTYNVHSKYISLPF